ncbi:tyrosine-type recombinase/integrase [Candidatus Latescibacterota bacterium]
MNSPTVYKRPDSPYWWLSWSVVQDDKPHRIQRSLKKYDLRIDEVSQDEALRRAKIALRLIDECPDPGDMNLAQFREYILNRLERKGLRPSTIKETRIALNHLAGHFDESHLVKSVTRAQVHEFQGYLLDRGLEPPSVNKVCRHCRQAFGILEDEGQLERNPFRKFQQVREIPRGPKFLTRTQVQKVLEIAAGSGNEAYYHLLMVALHTGIRRNEVLLIGRGDIDLVRDRIRVMNIKRHDRRKRWIKISPTARESFSWFLEHGAEGEYPLRICHPDTFTHWFKDTLREAGLPESLHLHSLRHSWVTLTGESGVDLWRIQKHVDHASIRTTEGYFHPDADLGDAIGPGY